MLLCLRVLTASAAPASHSFGYYWPSPNYLDTRQAANNVAAGLNGMGYSTTLDNNSAYAWTPRDVIGQDAVFFIFTHGAPGLLQGNGNTLFTAYESSNNYAYSIQYKYKNTSNKLRYVRFAVMGGCDTGFWGSTYGDFPSILTNYGVDSHITFRGTIFQMWINNEDKGAGYYFNNLFWYLSQNYDVYQSDMYARRDVYNAIGEYAGTNNSSIGGANAYPTGVKLIPAGYGSYY